MAKSETRHQGPYFIGQDYSIISRVFFFIISCNLYFVIFNAFVLIFF